MLSKRSHDLKLKGVPEISALHRIASTLLAITLLTLTLTTAHADDGLAGVYQGQVDGADAQLTLNEIGFSVTGRLQLANGYVIKLDGQRQGDSAAGTAASASGAASFELARDEDGVHLTLEEIAPLTGQTLRMRYEFHELSGSRAGADAVDTASGDRDLRLAGKWRGSEIRYAGDMVLRIAVALQLLEDGHYLQADDAASQTLSESTQNGQWRVDQGKLQLRQEGRSEWRILGFYQLRGDTLLLIDGDGKSQSWRRQ